MKTVNIRQTKEEFIRAYHLSRNNSYFKALQQVMELLNHSVYNNFQNINFTYDDNGLTYLSVGDEHVDNFRLIFSINKPNEI